MSTKEITLTFLILISSISSFSAQSAVKRISAKATYKGRSGQDQVMTIAIKKLHTNAEEECQQLFGSDSHEIIKNEDLDIGYDGSILIGVSSALVSTNLKCSGPTSIDKIEIIGSSGKYHSKPTTLISLKLGQSA